MSPGAALTFAFAFAQSPSDALVAHDSTVPIVGGDEVGPTEFPNVVGMRAGPGLCSGILVSPEVVLTAAHCVADVGFGRTVTMFYGPSFVSEQRHQVASWQLHPDYCADCNGDNFDLAFLQLTLPYEGELEPVVPIATQPEWDEAMRPGVVVTVVGYGLDENGDEQNKKSIDAQIADVSRSGVEFEFEAGGGGTCKGDSGGPVFTRLDSGETRLVGILRGSTGCGETSIGTSSYTGLCWLRDEAGVDLVPTDDPDCQRLGTSGCGCRTGSPAPPVGMGLLILFVVRRRR